MSQPNVYAPCPHLLDNVFPGEPILSNLIQATEELEKDLQFYWLIFQIGRIGPWEQMNADLLYLSDIWGKVFGIEETPNTLEEYVALMDDKSERVRIFEARSKLQHQAVGTRWESEYTLCGHKIRSIGFVAQDGTVAGLDIVF